METTVEIRRLPLEALAERINHEHAGCEAALRAGLAHALAAGRATELGPEVAGACG